MQALIEEVVAPDYLLIDARTGVTELGGFATTALADRIVFLSILNSESIDGLKVVVDAVAQTPRLGSRPSFTPRQCQTSHHHKFPLVVRLLQ